MAHYQSRTPKRHIAWSNSSKIGLFNMGRLTGFDYQSAEYKKHKTATTKVSKSGKKSFQGRKKELKASQCLRRKFTSKGAHAYIYIYPMASWGFTVRFGPRPGKLIRELFICIFEGLSI